MRTNKDFTFKVSLSLEKFDNKEISGAMTDTMKKKKVRETRKKYGYKPNRGVSYIETEETPSSLLDKLLSGHVFCHIFNVDERYRRKSDNSFGAWCKTLENFRHSYCVGVDIDKTNYKTPQEFIDKLTLKPTFWYTTYSHNTWDEIKNYGGPRFRLIYVFDVHIENEYWFKYINHHLLEIIGKDTGEDVYDRCSESAAQYFNGTNINTTPGVEYGCTDLIYEKEDIVGDINPSSPEFISYLKGFCGYREKTPEHKVRIKKLLERLTDNKYKYNSRLGIFEEEERVKDPLDIFDLPPEIHIPDDFLTEDMEKILSFWDKMSMDEFKKSKMWNWYRKEHRYIYRLEDRDWSKGYQVVGDDYFSLPFYHYKRLDGQHRRKTLYQRCCLRKYMYPNINKYELIFNYIMDVLMFVEDPDKDITSEVILKNVVACLNQTTAEIELKYRDLIEHYKNTTRPKRNIIRRDKEKNTREFTFQIIDDYYNESFEPKENYEWLKMTLPFSVSPSYFNEYLNSRGIKSSKRLSDDEMYEMIDVKLSGSKNIKMIRDKGYSCKKDRVYSLLKKKRETTHV